MPYIQPSHQKDLKEFQYKGTCASISYKYLWSPFGEFLLKFTPETIAPNTITLVAFIIIITSHLLIMFGGDSNFASPPEPWKYAVFGISLFLYQHLDNLDGKQARKTKNSSPVGMLFDHGCDAISSMLVGLQFLKLLQCQDIESSFYLLVLVILLPNFLVIWCQYGTGSFHFDEINPIDEGLPCYQLIGLFGYFFDYSFWKQQHWFSSYNYEFLIAFLVAAVFVCAKMCKGVLKDTKRDPKDVLKTLLLPTVLVGLIGVFKISGLLDLYLGELFYPFFYTLVFFWGRNEIYMQICSVANQQFNPLNWGTITYAITMILPIIIPAVRENLNSYLYICLTIQALFLIQLIISFLLQASRILSIKLFKINKPLQKKQ